MLRAIVCHRSLGPRAPGMRVERILAIRREKVDELPPFRRREARAHADVLEMSVVVVQAEQQ